MNSRQKEICQQYLDNEKRTLKELERIYKDALDEINNNLLYLGNREDADMQHVIYQAEYQMALKKQVETTLQQLHNNEFKTVSEYLTKCYEDGFIGTMYDLQGQGIPLILPIDQELMVAAIQHDTKLSESLYESLGKDVSKLKKSISSEISRGIATGQSYHDIARNLAGYAGISRNRAMVISRTEGHRIQAQATADAQWKAKQKGADIVKQWDSTLDGNTRPTHRQLDGQIQELEDPFEVAGMKAMQPGDFGIASEDCNCRCVLLQRARWNLGSGFSKAVKTEDGTKILDFSDAKDYDSFKKEYWKKIDEAKKEAEVRSNVQKINIDAPDIKNKLISKAYDDFNTVLLNSEGNEMMINRIIMASDTVDFVEDNTLLHAFAYIPDEDIIKYNSNIKHFEMYDLNYVQAHELSHRVDMKEIRSWKNSGFVGAIEKSRTIVEDNKETIVKWFENGGKHANDVALSDIISALSNGKLNDYLIAGHDEEYWNGSPMNVPIEIMANVSSIDIIGYDSKIELETMFKDLFDAYKVMVK